ncbi:MAG: zinc-ribbon domain-containing protein, partial [Candidatus Nanopelagicales bacterium]
MLASQADGWDPSTVVPGSGAKKPWRCPEGHRWEAAINSRNQGAGCPFCAGQRTIVGVNDLATTFPLLAAEAVG